MSPQVTRIAELPDADVSQGRKEIVGQIKEIVGQIELAFIWISHKFRSKSRDVVYVSS